MKRPNIPTELEAEIASVAKDTGCELVHVELERGVLRIFLDRDEGVTIADCTAVSRQLSPILDIHDFGKQRYVLEVSSPGLDRKFYRPGDYTRFLGYRVRTTFFHGESRAKSTLVGRLEAFEPADGGQVRFRDEETDTIHELSLGDIKSTRLEIDQDPDDLPRSAGSKA